MIKTGFIGCGNMGSALVHSIHKSLQKDVSINIFDINKNKTESLKKETNANISDSVNELINDSDIIILAVKPQNIKTILQELDSTSLKNKLIISIAAGISLTSLQNFIKNSRIIRVMPNTPSMIGEGVIAFSPLYNCTKEDIEIFKTLFSSSGDLYQLEEKLLDAVTGLSGSGPAYVFAAINAMAEGGVKEGLPKSIALPMAAKTFLGAAKMIETTGNHPEILKDMVTSPGGTTAAGLSVLEKKGLRSAFIEAVSAASKRSKELNNK